jgi:Leucine-rich repeat (LRR) protein
VVCHWRKLRTLNLERPRERDAVENRTQTAPALANVQALPLLHCLTLADVAHNVDDNGAQRIAQLLDEATNLTRLVITHTRPGYEYLNLQAVTRLSALTNLRELCIDFVQRDRNMMFGQVRDDQLWKDIGTLANLRVLDISRNQLRELPSCVFGLTNLEVLRANRNSITYVPGSVYILQRLRVLELASAHVVKLCRELLMLPGLLTINAQVRVPALPLLRRCACDKGGGGLTGHRAYSELANGSRQVSLECFALVMALRNFMR